MRELKFRAWSKKNKAWLNTEQSYLNLFNVHSGLYDILELDVQQFTGLKDQNSKDIYEGDLVKTVFHGKEMVREVMWRQDKFQLVPLDRLDVSICSLGLTLKYYTSAEVVGNIYE